MKLFELKNISVHYGNIPALKNVSFHIDQGEIISVIGANGAGKSTLLKVMTGLEPAAGGTVWYQEKLLFGHEGKSKTAFWPFGKTSVEAHQLCGMGIAMVPEGRGVFAQMSVLENLEMGAFLIRDRQKIQKKLDEMYSLFPILSDRRKQKAGSLSGGEQQMLSIARALMSSPKLLLLDEPGLGLAPLVIRDIFEVIVSLNRDHKVTVLLVEQNARMALSISHRGLVMETGTVVMEDASTALLNNPRVRQVYLGES